MLLTAVIALTLGYAFLSGLNDSGSLAAPAISSGAFSPGLALFLAAAAVFAGFFLFGKAVAITIGRDLVKPEAVTLHVLLISLLSAILWVAAAGRLGLPSSSTHALLGGLIGAVTVSYGPTGLLLKGLVKVLSVLFAAPLLGLTVGYFLMRLVRYATRAATPRVNVFFKRSQPFTMLVLAFSYGANDGQKGVALVAMALAVARGKAFSIPAWVLPVCAVVLTAGVGLGGRRTMRTVGRRIYRLRPVHAFAAQSASAAIMLGTSLFGGPVSTPQVVSTAIVGVGSAERVNAVRWQTAGQIAAAWLVTIPASALVAAALYLILVSVLKF